MVDTSHYIFAHVTDFPFFCKKNWMNLLTNLQRKKIKHYKNKLLYLYFFILPTSKKVFAMAYNNIIKQKSNNK